MGKIVEDVPGSVGFVEHVCSRIEAFRKIVSSRSGGIVEGQPVDMQTANVILFVYDRVNDQNKEKLLSKSIVEMAKICWKLV